MTTDRCRVWAGVTAATTVAWFAVGVAVWTDTQAPVWYRIVLCAGVGAVVWFTAGWMGWVEE